MNTNELRIGNYVLCDGKPEKVTGVIRYGVYFDFGYCPNIGIIKQIELNEEWLIKFGFDVENRPDWIDQLQEYSIVCGKIQYLRGCAKNIYPIKSVHQLQNLYFALTGEELKLNENL